MCAKSNTIPEMCMKESSRVDNRMVTVSKYSRVVKSGMRVNGSKGRELAMESSFLTHLIQNSMLAYFSRVI
jgi:hypothetical protein